MRGFESNFGGGIVVRNDHGRHHAVHGSEIDHILIIHGVSVDLNGLHVFHGGIRDYKGHWVVLCWGCRVGRELLEIPVRVHRRLLRNILGKIMRRNEGGSIAI